MPIKGKVLLGPVHQYTLFGRFPWALLLHIMILLTDTNVLLNVTYDINEFCRESRLFLYMHFLDPDFDVNDVVVLTRHRTYYMLDDFRD